MIWIRRVDGEAFRWVLMHLQLETLPDDKPLDPGVGAWWVVFDGPVPIGFASSRKSKRWSDAAYLSRAGVVAEHRGKGLQKRLIRVRERQARLQGMNWAITDTRDNPASANSLIAEGYRLYKPATAWGFKDSLYWRKNLRAPR